MISIGTIHKGPYKDLLMTIESVLLQNTPCDDYIVVASNLSIEQKNYVKLNVTKVFFDVDSSLYDAMNIGLKACQGSHVLFLNSGDVLIDFNVLSYCNNFVNDNKTIYIAPVVICLNKTCHLAPTIDRLISGAMPGHQGFLAPISIKKMYFTDTLNFWNDGEWMELYLTKYKSEVLHQPLVEFSFDGASSIPKLKNIPILMNVSYYLSIKYLIKFLMYYTLPQKIYFYILMRINGHTLWKKKCI